MLLLGVESRDVNPPGRTTQHSTQPNPPLRQPGPQGRNNFGPVAVALGARLPERTRRDDGMACRERTVERTSTASGQKRCVVDRKRSTIGISYVEYSYRRIACAWVHRNRNQGDYVTHTCDAACTTSS
jgi:hypothetical protein